MRKKPIVSIKLIESKIYLIRGKKVMLDKDLAELYKVTTSNLNKSVKRNIERFPKDFMFRLTSKEYLSLRFHFGISKKGKGGRRYLPYVFTEQGIAMLSSVLRSNRAIQVNIQIMRTFIKIKQLLLNHDELKRKIESLEKKYDYNFIIVFDAIKKLIEVKEKPKRKIGF